MLRLSSCLLALLPRQAQIRGNLITSNLEIDEADQAGTEKEESDAEVIYVVVHREQEYGGGRFESLEEAADLYEGLWLVNSLLDLLFHFVDKDDKHGNRKREDAVVLVPAIWQEEESERQKEGGGQSRLFQEQV